MKNHQTHISFLLALILFINVSSVNAQEIKGDTIYVNTEAEVLVRFPTLPGFFNTVPSNAPYNFKTAGTGFTVIAKEENSKSAPLTVSEGGRTHHFLLVFKKDINYDNDAELDYDYSTIKKLEQHIKDSKSANVQKTATAKLDNNKATAVANSMAEANAAELDINRKYVDITSEAKNHMDLKEYAKAKEEYKQALQLRPGDLYANHQIDKIDGILQEENGKKEQDKLKTLYDGYINAGEKALNQNLLTDARIAFQQALVIKENDPTATNRIELINDKEKKQKEKVEFENNYADIIRDADKYFQKGDYDNAGIQYKKANNLISRPWPQEQLKNIDKLLADKATKENEQKQNIAKQAESEKKEQENRELENTYSGLIKSADELFKSGDYANAKNKYTMASDVIKRPWPAEQIIKINSILSDLALKEKSAKEKELQQQLDDKRLRDNQEIEKNYNNAIQIADKYYQDNDYNNAISAYNKAVVIIRKPYPEDQIKKINQILADQAEQKKKDKIIAAQQATINAKYQTSIQRADQEFDKRNYSDSRKYYIAASTLKPDESRPRERLLEIENTLESIALENKRKKDSISTALELKKKYDFSLSMANTYFSKGDLVNAKASYLEAMNVKPGEEVPRNQVNLINKKLEDIAKEEAIKEKYDNSISRADSFLIAKDLENALKWYTEANQTDENAYYAKAQIKYLQAEIIHNQKTETVVKENQIEVDYANAIAIADKAITDKKYDEAKSAYSKALKIHPDNKYALQRFKIATYQFQLQKNNFTSDSISTINKSIAEKEIEDKLHQKKYNYQENSIPYTNKELTSKYPAFDFLKSPPEQFYNSQLIKFEDHQNFIKETLSQQPRLTLASSANNINLFCVGINFDRNLVYLKFILQNNSKKDFLTGPILLTWTRINGNLIKLYPVYIYPDVAPILQPGNQIALIYVCKSYIITEQDNFHFEMSDRLNKTKLLIDIPGTIYTHEMNRDY